MAEQFENNYAELASGIRSGCVKGWEFGGIVPAGSKVVFAFVGFVQIGAGLKDCDEASDRALGQLSQDRFEL